MALSRLFECLVITESCGYLSFLGDPQTGGVSGGDGDDDDDDDNKGRGIHLVSFISTLCLVAVSIVFSQH